MGDGFEFVINSLPKKDFQKFITMMMHDFCHDIDSSKSNGAFYNLFQTEKTNNRINKINSHIQPGYIIHNGGNGKKNVSFVKEIDEQLCNNTSVTTYIPQDTPPTIEEFYQKFYFIYSSEDEDVYENYRIIYSIVKDVIEHIKFLVEQGMENQELLNSIKKHFESKLINIEVDPVKEMEMLNEAGASGNDPLPIMVEFLYEEYIKRYSTAYLSMLFNPVEIYIKEYIEINYNFKDISYKDPDIIKAGAQDYISCPYRFRTIVEIISNLVEVYGSFKVLYQEYSTLYNDNFGVERGVKDGILFQRKKYSDINEEYKLNMFYEIVNTITYNFTKEFDKEIFNALKERLSANRYFTEHLDIEGIKTIYINDFEQLRYHVADVNEIEEEEDGPPRARHRTDGGGGRPREVRGGGLKDDIVNNFNRKLKEINDLITAYSNGYYSINNFDNTIIDLIINPNDNLPYSDFVNDSENPEDIQKALDKVLLADQGGISKVTISKKLTELKEHKKILENNGKQLMCYIYRTPPHISSNNPLLLYKNDFDGLIFLEIYDIIYYIHLEKAEIEKAEKAKVKKALKTFGDMSDKELKAELKERDLPTDGGRDDYMERLTEAAKKEAKKAVSSGQLPENFVAYDPIYINPFMNYLTLTYPDENGTRFPKDQGNLPPKLRPQGIYGIQNIMNKLTQFFNMDMSPLDFYNEIERIININKRKIDLIEKQTEFLKYQKPYYTGKGNLTPKQKSQKKDRINGVINYYKENMGDFEETDFFWKQEYEMIFNENYRPEGGSLDKTMWEKYEAKSINVHEFMVNPHIRDSPEYINNAISSKYRPVLGKNKLVRCFSSLIDPMGNFGDCSFLDDVTTIKGTIHIKLNVDDNSYMKITLPVISNNNVSIENGSVYLKINGDVAINLDINESNFNKKTPFSISNTVSGFNDKPGGLNNRNQAVKKFLGDYLQGIEAITKKLIYYSGDKPATVMYDYMNSIFSSISSPPPSYGGFVNPIDDEIQGRSLPPPSAGGAGGKKKTKTKRRKKTKTKRRKKTKTKRRKKTKTKRRKKTKTKRRRTNRRKKK